MNAMTRTPASPYARRLARERGIVLSAIAGSGPNGRIVGADIPLALPTEPVTGRPPEVATSPTTLAVAPSRSLGAFAASVNLEPLRAFNAALETAFPLECFLIKAAAWAAEGHATGICWQGTEGRPLVLSGAADLSPSTIARLIGNGKSTGGDRSLLLSRITQQGIRPVSAPLPAGFDLRLLVVAGDNSPEAEVLLVHDTDVISEADAAKVLAAFRHFSEAPLQLLV
jgi:e3 binding domain